MAWWPFCSCDEATFSDDKSYDHAAMICSKVEAASDIRGNRRIPSADILGALALQLYTLIRCMARMHPNGSP